MYWYLINPTNSPCNPLTWLKIASASGCDRIRVDKWWWLKLDVIKEQVIRLSRGERIRGQVDSRWLLVCWCRSRRRCPSLCAIACSLKSSTSLMLMIRWRLDLESWRLSWLGGGPDERWIWESRNRLWWYPWIYHLLCEMMFMYVWSKPVVYVSTQ